MRKKIVISLILVLVMISTNIVATLAVTQSEINDLKEKQDSIESKKAEKEERQEEVQEELSEKMKEIQNLTSQISEFESQIEELDGQLSELEDSIDETEIKLEEAEKKYNEQEEALQARIVAQYEAGETTYLDVILGGGSLWDMISNWQIVSDIAEMDNQLLEEIEANKNEIEEAKQSLETSKKQVETLKSSKEETNKSLKNSQAMKEEKVSELSEEEKTLQEEIDQLTEENSQLTSQLKQKEQQYAQQIADLNNGTNKPTGGQDFGGSGILQKPVTSGTITATMYYSSGAYHGALDYGVPIGTNVYAAADGVVLAAGWRSGGLGYCVVIQHANGLRTYYGHGNGTFYVSEGATVARGQLIMLSGNSGNSSGPHLHFEVRVSPYNWSYGGNDSRRDPRNYM